MDGDGDADQRYRYEHPAQGVEIGHQREDRRLGFRQDLLRHFDTSCTNGRDARCPAVFQGPAVSQYFAGGLGFLHKGRGARNEGFAPRPRKSEVDVHEIRAGVCSEAEETDSAGRLGESHWIMVRHGNVKRRAQHVLRGRSPTDGAVVAGAAIAGTDDQRLSEAIAQRLQLVHRFGVDLDRTGAAAGDLDRGKAGPALGVLRHVAEMGRRHVMPRPTAAALARVGSFQLAPK